MCKSVNVDFIDNNKNYDPKKKLNNSKLHLNNKGSDKLSNILVNYICSINKWYDINKPCMRNALVLFVLRVFQKLHHLY